MAQPHPDWCPVCDDAGDVTDEMLDRAVAAFPGVVDRQDMRDALEAALRPLPTARRAAFAELRPGRA